MTYHNILSNPTLQTSEDALHVEKIHVLDYPPQYIWHPIQWKTTDTPTVRGEYRKRADDLHIIPTVWPQTINNKKVLTIEANTKHFVVKLEQFAIPLKAHQRYLVKVLFTPAVVPMGEATPTDLAWRITVDQRSAEYTDGFQSAANVGEWGQQRSALLVVHSYADQTVDLWVEFWSKFGNLDKQIYIHSIEILEVETAYGEGGSVWSIGTPSTEPPDPDPTPDPEPEPLPDETLMPMPAWMVMILGIVGAIVVGVVIYALLAPRLAASAMEGSIMEDVLNQLFAIPAIAPIAFSGALILYLVELGKRLKVKYLPDVALWLSPEFMVVFWVVFFMGAFGIAEQYQYDNVFKQVAELVTQLVGVLGPYVLAMIGTQVTVAYAHKNIRKVDVPGFDQ